MKTYSRKPSSTNLTCISKREGVAFYQCDDKDCFYLEINKRYYSFRVCEFIVFRKKMKDLDISSLFQSDAPDYHLFELSHCGSFFLLSLYELIQLKMLTEEAIETLRENSLFRSITNEIFKVKY